MPSRHPESKSARSSGNPLVVALSEVLVALIIVGLIAVLILRHLGTAVTYVDVSIVSTNGDHPHWQSHLRPDAPR